MTSAYLTRLTLLCLASGVVLHAVLSILAASIVPRLLRYAEALTPRAASHLLFVIRIAPTILAITLVLGFCIPSYLRFEPSSNAERTGLKCFLLAALCVIVIGRAIFRASYALFHSLRYVRFCRRHGREMEFADSGEAPVIALVVDHPAPVIAVAGIFHQRIIVSRVLLETLSAEEFDAVLQHEKAHRFSWDNLKHFFMLLTPEPFFLPKNSRAIQAHWVRFTEWAADDHAANGDSLRAVSLASALLCCARMGGARPVPVLVSPLYCDSAELSIRVDRLLRIKPPRDLSPENIYGSAANGCIAFSIILAIGILSPAIFPLVHELLEYLIR